MTSPCLCSEKAGQRPEQGLGRPEATAADAVVFLTALGLSFPFPECVKAGATLGPAVAW